MTPRLIAAISLAASFTLGAGVAHAGPFTAEYVFGDSLSDNGNLAEAYFKQNFPNPPSFHDSFTNGPVAVTQLANYFGLQLNPSLFVTGFTDPYGLFGGPSFVPGTNYAVAGATAAALPPNGGIPGANLPQQVGAYVARASGVADPSVLYVLFTGGNDVRNAAIYKQPTSVITTAVLNEVAAAQTLIADGAKHLLVVNVPNVGAIPEFTQDPTQNPALATTLSQQYDQTLAADINCLTLSSGTTLTQFDLYGYNAGIAARAKSLGFTNTTDPCFTNTPLSPAATPGCGPNGANVNQYLYWDSIHPTAPVQTLWAQGFEAALVPEPSSALLLGLGVAGLAVMTRRRIA